MNFALRVVVVFLVAFGGVALPFLLLLGAGLIFGGAGAVLDEDLREPLLTAQTRAFGPEATAADRLSVPADTVAQAVEAQFPDGTRVVVMLPAQNASAWGAIEAYADTRDTTRRTTIAMPGNSRIRLTLQDGTRGELSTIGDLGLAVFGPDDQAIRARTASLPFVIADPKGQRFADALDRLWPYLVVGFLVYLLLLVPIVLRVASWAVTVRPSQGQEPLSTSELRKRLEALEGAGLPFRIEPTNRDDEVIVSWNTIDAAWIGLLMQGERRRRIDRMRLRFFPDEHVVRSIDTVQDISVATASEPGTVSVSGSASFFRGIVFEAIEVGAVPGIVWQGDRPNPEPGYHWSFTRSEMRRAVAKIVTDAGWTLRPVATFSRFLNG